MTRFVFDGEHYEGPDIHARNFETAQLIAESQGLIIDGEAKDLSDCDLESQSRMIH